MEEVKDDPISIKEGPKDFKPKHHIICYLAAIGFKGFEISKEVEVNPTIIAHFLNKEKVKAEIRGIQRRLLGEDPKKRFDSLLHDAIDTISSIMNDASEKGLTRLSAAQIIKDASMGKATQHIEVGGNLIRELFERLDKKESIKQIVDVTPILPEKQILLASPIKDQNVTIDPVQKQDALATDAWCKENL